MNAQEIEFYLSLVGEKLQAMQVNEDIPLLLVGGGYMLTQIQSRTQTKDIDVAWISTTYGKDSDLYRRFRQAIYLLSEEHELSPFWFNTDVTHALQEVEGAFHSTLWKTFGPLHIYVPSKEFILVSKLLAGREKDFDDIRVLCAQLDITTITKAQQLLDNYVSREIQQKRFVEDKLTFFFRPLIR